MENIEQMRSCFKDIASSVKRDGIDSLLRWLDHSDFYTAPASSRFHGCYAGGLLEHSLNVYVRLLSICQRYPKHDIDPDSIIITGLFHDICKVNYYTTDYKNVKVYSEAGSKRDDRGNFDWVSQPIYKVEDKLPLGHGEKSVIILQHYLTLTRDEIYAIRYHMGGFDTSVKGGDFSLSAAYEICPFAVMAHLADMEATYLIETHKT